MNDELAQALNDYYGDLDSTIEEEARRECGIKDLKQWKKLIERC